VLLIQVNRSLYKKNKKFVKLNLLFEKVFFSIHLSEILYVYDNPEFFGGKKNDSYLNKLYNREILLYAVWLRS